VRALIVDMEREGRGVPTIRRVHATLRSALSDAVRQRRVTHNVAEHVPLPAAERKERELWTVDQAVGFLDSIADDRLWPVYETILGAALRRGEALALRWSDVNLEGRTLHVRRTLSRVKGKGLVFTSPKTRGSLAGVGLSPRVVLALTAQRARQEAERAEWGEVYQDGGLVFSREDGRPYDPRWVLDQFYELSNAAGLRRVHIHDLRHLSMTLMLINGVPLPLASKVARHSKVSITADLYAHLTPEASTAAVDAAAAALDAARAVHQSSPCDHTATTEAPSWTPTGGFAARFRW
jgi:integrase